MGLRERKKERMRDQLAATACHLFTEQGYEATTVEQIAAAMDVSSRTFFRYYPTKADVATALLQTVGLNTLQALAVRPRTEPLMTSLRIAAHAPVDACQERTGEVFKVLRMLEGNPALRGHLHEEQVRMRDQLASTIADRLEIGEASDLRPRLIADLLVSALGAALDHWCRTGGRTDLRQTVDAALDVLDCGVRNTVGAGVADG